MDEILEILEQEARRTPEQIAKMTRRKPADVRKRIAQYEKDGVIVGYHAVINHEMVKDENAAVTAFIEVRVQPQKDLGFDHIAERICAFPEVLSCTLLSGSYDLLLTVKGRDIQSVSRFVAEKLSPIENVKGTVTHFMLRRYKVNGVMLKQKEEHKRINISY